MIGQVISHLLTAATGLTTLVPSGSIYPYIANEDTSLPLIVYTVDTLVPDYDKGGWLGDACTFSIISMSTNYSNLQDIVYQVRKAIELKNGTNHDIEVRNIYLDGQQEGFNITENVFMNRLTFRTEVLDYTSG